MERWMMAIRGIREGMWPGGVEGVEHGTLLIGRQ
jgi:hypothetical protein